LFIYLDVLVVFQYSLFYLFMANKCNNYCEMIKKIMINKYFITVVGGMTLVF